MNFVKSVHRINGVGTTYLKAILMIYLQMDSVLCTSLLEHVWKLIIELRMPLFRLYCVGEILI